MEGPTFLVDPGRPGDPGCPGAPSDPGHPGSPLLKILTKNRLQHKNEFWKINYNFNLTCHFVRRLCACL